MKIRKATKKDLKEYIKIKEGSLKEYSKLAGHKITLSKNKIKNELFESVKNPKRLILFSEGKEISGYIVGSFIKSDYSSMGCIDDLFVLRKFRKKGIALKLIKEFMKLSKKDKIKIIRLGVKINNKPAIKLYKKLGFEIKHYEMDKKLK